MISMTDAAFLQMLTDFQNLMTSNYILEGSLNMSEGQVLAKLIGGEVAMYYATTDVIGRIVEADPNSAEALALSGKLDTSDAESAFSQQPNVRVPLYAFHCPSSCSQAKEYFQFAS